VGHYAALVRALDQHNMRAPLIGAIQRGVPFLGICLGLQVLFDSSEEAPQLRGLQLLPGTVCALPSNVKLPHMGWNQVAATCTSRLLEGIDTSAYFYFAHSYAVLDSNGASAATCLHGAPFAAVVEKQNIFRRAIPSGKERRRGGAPLAEFSEDCGMSLAHRIIPCLDTDGARVVKGVNFVGLRDAGDPVALAARYNAEGADELVVLDIAASRDRRPTFLETIRRVAAELSIPLTAGGGIRTLEDGRSVVRAGADKVTVNTAAVERPELISELSREFGAQAVVLAIDAKRAGNHWDVYGSRWARIRLPRCHRVGANGSRSRCR